MSVQRDYESPAGCADGCAATMGGLTLLLAVLVGLVWRRRGGRR